MIIEEDNERFKKKWVKIENKKRILNKIEGYFEEFHDFLRTCDVNTLSEETITEKIKLIHSYIKEYKKNFYDTYQFPEKTLDNEFYSVRQNSRHSLLKDFPSQREPSFSLRNKETYTSPELSFSNFIKFYDRTSIHNNIKL